MVYCLGCMNKLNVVFPRGEFFFSCPNSVTFSLKLFLSLAKEGSGSYIDLDYILIPSDSELNGKYYIVPQLHLQKILVHPTLFATPFAPPLPAAFADEFMPVQERVAFQGHGDNQASKLICCCLTDSADSHSNPSPDPMSTSSLNLKHTLVLLRILEEKGEPQRSLTFLE